MGINFGRLGSNLELAVSSVVIIRYQPPYTAKIPISRKPKPPFILTFCFGFNCLVSSVASLLVGDRIAVV